MMVTNCLVKENIKLVNISKGQWTLYNSEGLNIRLNDVSAQLIFSLQNSNDLYEAYCKFSSDNSISIEYNDFVNVIKAKFTGYNVLHNDDGSRLMNRRPLIFQVNLIGKSKMDSISKPFKFLFHSKYFWFLFSLSFIIIMLLNVYISTKTHAISFENTSIYKILIFTFASVVFHEIGHFAAAKKFGVNTGKLGVGIYFLFPVFYSDLSNIWQLTKVKRLIVNLGGIYFQLLYALFFALIYIRYKDVNFLLVSLAVGTGAFWQFLPFFRLDGYWVISDYFEIPNMFLKSQLLVSNYVKNIFNQERTNIVFENLSKVKHKFIFWFGLINYLLMFVWIFVVGIKYNYKILLFPKNLYDISIQCFNKDFSFFTQIKELIVLLLFYVIFIKMMFNIINNRKKEIR